jgi:hypothetical protein
MCQPTGDYAAVGPVCNGRLAARTCSGRRAKDADGGGNVHREVRDCLHCPNTVVMDGRGGWVHTGHVGYSCRDAAAVTMSTYAEPVPRPRTNPSHLVGPFQRPTGRTAVSKAREPRR